MNTSAKKWSDRLKAWKAAATLTVPHNGGAGPMGFYIMQPMDLSTLENWPFLQQKAAFYTEEFDAAHAIAKVWANELEGPMWIVRVGSLSRTLDTEVFPDEDSTRIVFEEMETPVPDAGTPGFGEF